MKNRKWLLIVSLVLALTMSLGGTLAYLQDTDEAVNVMVLGNVEIDQYENGKAENGFTNGQPLYPAYYAGEKEDSWKAASDTTGSIKKVVDVKNVGSSKAYIRTLFAMEIGELTDAEFEENIHLEWKLAATPVTKIDIDGAKYQVFVYTYPEAIEAGAMAGETLQRVVMDKYATNEIVKKLGDTYEILVLSQAVQVNNLEALGAAGALNEAFKEVNEENATKWFGGVYNKGGLPTTTVTTADNLKTALANGGIVVLGADIDMDADETITIAAGKNARLYLAGHTLSGVADGTGNREMFLVKGNLTVENGTIEMSATVNQKWDKMSTIFDVTAGGVLNLNGVTAKNLGGTDMAFVAHLNNWGEVTLNVNNSTLQSTYCAVRVNNSGYDKNNVSIHNSTIWGDNRAFWVHNYIGDLNSSEHSNEAIEARLNFDIGDKSNIYVGRLVKGFNVEVPIADVVFTPIYNTNAKLEAALDEGKTDILVAAGTYTFPASSIKAGTTITCAEGTVFEGNSKLNINGATVIGATFSNPSGTAVDQTINGTFKDCTFTGSNALRWCYAGETVVFENCVFSGSSYGAHFDGGANEVIFKNCTFSGFNAMGAAITKLTLDGCTFVANGKSNYNGINLWGSTDLIDCTFVFDGSVGYEWVDLCNSNKTVNFTGCVIDDGTTVRALTSADVGDYGTGNTINIK